MKSSSIKASGLSVLFVFAALVYAQAQPKSPKMTANGKVGDANITIEYSSPSANGREIWGGLVPYGKVWRAGANNATTFETDKDIMVGVNKLAKGKYSIYILPTENEWQVIFNKEVGQWGINRDGTTTRKPESDVFIVKTKPMAADMQESLIYTVGSDSFSIGWEKLKASVPLK
ncbi:MAG: DUF2911 domain-containing protein [Imperialibacter sp.]|uniref:DUF2911 domain-containing protein n=1 Tax=Imperialibacter sp. TaxID=2038411 RepID=UPI0032EFB23F